jgi:hypothetical protein
MLSRSAAAAFLLLVSAAIAWPASSHRVLIRTTDGQTLEGDTKLAAVQVAGASAIGLDRVLSIHNGAPPSDSEKSRIVTGLAAIQGEDRKARDLAVEELTAIGLPVMTLLLQAYKDTDQHEPRPLYRLFERIIPSYADGFDREQSLIRLEGGEVRRAALSAQGDLELKTADGKSTKLAWSDIRTLAVRQRLVTRKSVPVHSLKHSTQIEYLDSGVALSAGSKLESSTRGFVRLSWDTDSWASDPNGLTKPGSPAFKSHLVDGHPFGALVGRIGAAGEVFFLGAKASKTGHAGGRLALAINDNGHWQNNLGTFYVTLTATEAYDLGDAQ